MASRINFQNQVKEVEEIILRGPGKTVMTGISIGHEGGPEAGRHLHTNLKKSLPRRKEKEILEWVQMRKDSKRLEQPVSLVDGETEFCDKIALPPSSYLNFRHFSERSHNDGIVDIGLKTDIGLRTFEALETNGRILTPPTNTRLNLFQSTWMF
ncbi:hypothetical protein BGAL_0113g00140 [Botrytis galanthina]|uniref:Uncharacterized protein n=1 Tax=Botrytis galanthina TaxID=278940 RepID=A0A4S8RAM2_9HELO|nr:hypothetical protein BGAL_0113g00140 [Botrytis galanthina]